MSWAFDEGHNTRKNDAEIYNQDSATSTWLTKNKLNHLIPLFAEESITIEELLDMTPDTLNIFLDELANDDSIKFKKRDKIRVTSKLKPQTPADPAPVNHQPVSAHHSIITEAEISAFDSLDQKFKQLSSQEKSIQNRLNEFEAEYIKQQKILNTTFVQIVSNVQQRKNTLLTQMKQKRDQYKNKLSQRMKSVTNQRSLLTHVKLKCEQDINDSAVTSLQTAHKRANNIIQLIDETLLDVQQHHDGSKINNNVYVKFDISDRINDDIKQWGDVMVIGDKPPVPVINVLTVTGKRIVIEMLCDESYTGVLSKYECQSKVVQDSMNKRKKNKNRGYSGGYRGYRSNRAGRGGRGGYGGHVYGGYSNAYGTVQQSGSITNDDELKQDDGSKVTEMSMDDKNIGFFCLTGSQQGRTYNIRVRAVHVSKDKVMKGDWSEWSVVNTKSCPPSRERPQRAVLPFPIQKTVIKLNEWHQCCQGKKIALSLYQLQRVFGYVKFIQAQELKNNINIQSANNIQWLGNNRYGQQYTVVDDESSDTVSVNGFGVFVYETIFETLEWKRFQTQLRNIYQKKQTGWW